MGKNTKRSGTKGFFRKIAGTAMTLAALVVLTAAGSIRARAGEISDASLAVASYTLNGTSRYFDSLKSATDTANQDSAAGKTGGLVQLLKDETYSYTANYQGTTTEIAWQRYGENVILSGEYTLDLNGHSYNATSENSAGFEPAILVESGRILLINSDQDHPAVLNDTRDSTVHAFNQAIRICRNATLEIGGSSTDPALKSYEIQFYGVDQALEFRHEGETGDLDKAISAHGLESLDAKSGSRLLLLGGTNTFTSRKGFALRVRSGQCIISGGNNQFIGGKSEYPYKDLNAGCGIAYGGTLQITGGHNEFTGGYNSKDVRNPAICLAHISMIDEQNPTGTLLIQGGNNTLKGAAGLIGRGDGSQNQKFDVTLDGTLYLQTPEGGTVTEASLEGLKEATYALISERGDLTFAGNGGKTTDGKESYTQTMFLYAATPLMQNAFSRDHYYFEGWTDANETADANNTADVNEVAYADGADFTLTGSGPNTLRAVWKPESWKVVLDPSGGTIASGKDVTTYAYETAAALPTKEEITKEGYQFLGWFDNKDFSGNAITSIVSGTTGDQTYYAKWEAIPYHLTYDLNGGTLEKENPSTYTTDQNVTILNPTRTGYSFTGWTEKDTDTPVTTFLTKGKTGDIALKANWKEETAEPEVPEKTYYILTFDSKGGSSVLSQSVEEGKTASRPEDPAREGYTFLEWQKDGRTFDFTTPITADTSLSAVWMQKSTEDENVVVEKNEITEVPSVIQEAHPELDLSTPKKLNDFMLKEVTELFSSMDVTVEEIERKQAYESYDVDLKITITKSDGTTEQVKVTEENYESLIPASGIDTILPYPASVDRSRKDVDYTFAGVHVCEHNFGQYQAGDVEKLAPIPTEKGLLVHLSGLSPVMITWQEKAREEIEPKDPEDPEVEPVKPTDPDKKPADPDKPKDQSATSDKKDKPREKTLLEKLRESLASTPAHVCQDSDFQWETKEGTETEDGCMEYKCRKCGNIKYSVPISAYYTFNRNISDKIRKAATGSTVEVATPVFVSFHEMVKDALLANPDVTVKVNYRYQGKFYDMTIPAGRTKEQLDLLWNGTRFCGFRNMATQFATVEK